MKMKKTLTLLMAAVLLCALLAACGDNNKGEEPTPVASGTDVPETPVQEPSPAAESAEPADPAEPAEPTEPAQEQPAAGDALTGDQALDIALKDAGLSLEQVTCGTPVTDHSGSTNFYRMQFWTETTIYEYDVDMTTGEILSKTDVPAESVTPATETDIG